MSELGQPLPVGAIAHLTCGWSLHIQRACRNGVQDAASSQRTLTKHPAVVLRRRPGQRLGPNAGGGVKRGTGGCWWIGLVVVRLVAGIAAGVAGCWFGVSGSWSRMRHHRAAAGWSSGRGPAAAADRRRWVASCRLG
jgi:hypothetical protein